MINTAAVIGLGTMGPGMAATLTRGGADVKAYDVSADALGRAKEQVPAARDALERIGGRAASRRGEVSYHSDLRSAVEGAELIIEAVPEQADLKARVFADLEDCAAADAILASNTSGLPISKLQEGLRSPERVVGMHWSNPPHIIPVIEVICGRQTSSAVADRLRTTVDELGMIPVLVKKDVPGFVENRVLYAIMRECLALADDGVVDPADLDTCVKWGIGFKLSVIGPLELLDVAGLDIYQAVASYLNPDLSVRTDVSETITKRVERGDLGIKSGAGIYPYTPEGSQQLGAQRASALAAVRRTLEGR